MNGIIVETVRCIFEHRHTVNTVNITEIQSSYTVIIRLLYVRTMIIVLNCV